MYDAKAALSVTEKCGKQKCRRNKVRIRIELGLIRSHYGSFCQASVRKGKIDKNFKTYRIIHCARKHGQFCDLVGGRRRPRPRHSNGTFSVMHVVEFGAASSSGGKMRLSSRLSGKESKLSLALMRAKMNKTGRAYSSSSLGIYTACIAT